MGSSAAPPPAAAAFTSDLREVARVAAASRLCVVALAVLADLLLPDHLAQGALQAPFEPSCAAAPLLRAFTRWDAAHFLRVAQHGWRDEWSYAFFPLYPLLLRLASGTARHLPLLDQLCEQERTCAQPCAREADAALCREGYDHMHPGCGTLYVRLTPVASRSGWCWVACSSRTAPSSSQRAACTRSAWRCCGTGGSRGAARSSSAAPPPPSSSPPSTRSLATRRYNPSPHPRPRPTLSPTPSLTRTPTPTRARTRTLTRT